MINDTQKVMSAGPHILDIFLIKAQEAGVPPVSILTGTKKMQFSHLCSSVIPYPIGTKFATGVLAS